MAQFSIVIAVGTLATFLATVLFCLRIETGGRRRIVALIRRWDAASTPTSVIALTVLYLIGVGCFAAAGGFDRGDVGTAATENGFATHSAQVASDEPDSTAGEVGDLEALRSYAEEIKAKSPSTEAAPSEANSASLPDVDTMIAKLVARLERQPDDVNGWTMLGWSYLNTGKPKDAEIAYETALKLRPNDTGIKKALDKVRSSLPSTQLMQPSDSASSAVANEDAGGEGASQSEAQQSQMIRGMVDRLAARLETSPDDENGWVRLMRSRMTLGETTAAKAALAKALAVFASNSAAKSRLTAAARELGVEGN